MATVKRIPTIAAKKTAEPAKKIVNFALTKENYKLIAIGFGVMILGYILMIGGGSDDVNVFREDALFSFRRITLAPILIVGGFLFEIYAIMKRPKEKE
ncbi:MAG: DUF3098 domain-containing protein [Bacteroidales bacterium]|nr:DUF3098 domain-containing protein [Bacteroidales bacterium]MCL2133076.1 DUF3098 domain-containing protein [Bacteroidales bacterium]